MTAREAEPLPKCGKPTRRRPRQFPGVAHLNWGEVAPAPHLHRASEPLGAGEDERGRPRPDLLQLRPPGPLAGTVGGHRPARVTSPGVRHAPEQRSALAPATCARCSTRGAARVSPQARHAGRRLRAGSRNTVSHSRSPPAPMARETLWSGGPTPARRAPRRTGGRRRSMSVVRRTKGRLACQGTTPSVPSNLRSQAAKDHSIAPRRQGPVAAPLLGGASRPLATAGGGDGDPGAPGASPGTYRGLG